MRLCWKMTICYVMISEPKFHGFKNPSSEMNFTDFHLVDLHSLYSLLTSVPDFLCGFFLFNSELVCTRKSRGRVVNLFASDHDMGYVWWSIYMLINQYPST